MSRIEERFANFLELYVLLSNTPLVQLEIHLTIYLCISLELCIILNIDCP